MTGGRVVVLGPTGRNFAAGMSGGVAYVLDLDRRRGSTARWSTSSRSTDDDREFLRDIVEQHVAETGSPVAGSCSPTGTRRVDRFVKVMPKRLQAGARPRGAAAEGRDVDEAS